MNVYSLLKALSFTITFFPDKYFYVGKEKIIHTQTQKLEQLKTDKKIFLSKQLDLALSSSFFFVAAAL